MRFRHDELAWFLEQVRGIERLLTGTIGALLIFAFMAIGVYVISQLLSVGRRRLAEPPRKRSGASSSIDTWRESASRLATPTDDEAQER